MKDLLIRRISIQKGLNNELVFFKKTQLFVSLVEILLITTCSRKMTNLIIFCCNAGNFTIEKGTFNRLLSRIECFNGIGRDLKKYARKKGKTVVLRVILMFISQVYLFITQSYECGKTLHLEIEILKAQSFSNKINPIKKGYEGQHS